MNEIVCPHCQKAFKVDESGYAEILKQVHNKDFERQFAEKVKALEDSNRLATANAILIAKRFPNGGDTLWWSMGNSWQDNSSVRENKRVSGMLGCIDEGRKVLPVIFFKG